jgi:hypothetical protein
VRLSMRKERTSPRYLSVRVAHFSLLEGCSNSAFWYCPRRSFWSPTRSTHDLNRVRVWGGTQAFAGIFRCGAIKICYISLSSPRHAVLSPLALHSHAGCHNPYVDVLYQHRYATSHAPVRLEVGFRGG